jgi:small subunit ribosomal protein S9
MEKKTKTVKEKKVRAPKKAVIEEVSTEFSNEEEAKKNAFKDIPETAEFKGEYIQTVGRRKTSVAQVRMYKDGKGVIMINGKKGSQFFVGEGMSIVTQPLKATGHVRDLNFSIIVKGGGITGQIEACRHGLARALLVLDPLLKEALKANKFLTREPRKKERKKPGFKGARKRPQWSKR